MAGQAGAVRHERRALESAAGPRRRTDGRDVLPMSGRRISSEPLPHVQLQQELVRKGRGTEEERDGGRTMPRLHCVKLFIRKIHSCGSSSLCSLIHSCGVRPWRRTHAERRTQLARSARNPAHARESGEEAKAAGSAGDMRKREELLLGLVGVESRRARADSRSSQPS